MMMTMMKMKRMTERAMKIKRVGRKEMQGGNLITGTKMGTLSLKVEATMAMMKVPNW